MPGFISGGPLARELIRIGDQVIAAEDDAEPWAYFAADYVFRGPGGDLSFDRASFASLRAAFATLSADELETLTSLLARLRQGFIAVREDPRGKR